MKILICCDSFKDSVSSEEISYHLTNILINKFPELAISSIIIADGGEGSLSALSNSTEMFRYQKCETLDALLRPISAAYLVDEMNNRAVIEMAQSCGLQLLTKEERNCMYTSSYGVGLQIKDALNQGLKNIELFIGGSATNDLGLGMLSALGGRVNNRTGNIKCPVGKNMNEITSIDLQNLKQYEDCTFNIVCDVENKLLGPKGAAHTYAMQKGANESDIEELEEGAKNICRIVSEKYNNSFENQTGAGAAGGMGFGAMAFLNAKYFSGVNYLLDLMEVEKKIAEADLIITGEGKIDQQTLNGKLVKGVADRAQLYGRKTIALSAINSLGIEAKKKLSIDNYYTLYSSEPKEISKKDTLDKLENAIHKISQDYIYGSL